MVTTIVEEDILVRDQAFEWGPVIAGAVVATGATFFLIVVGAALGLTLAGTRNLSGGHSFLAIGAIYFLAAQAFGFALGGHITGRLMTPAPESQDEHFRADVHGLGVWSLAAVFGLTLAALTVQAGLAQPAPGPSQPTAYWADKLLTGAPVTDYDVHNAEVARLLAADMINPAGPISDDRSQLTALVSVLNGMPQPVAVTRIESVENGIRAQADAVRRTAVYLTMWTALALLLGGFAAITATVLARFHDEDFSFRRG